MIKKLLIFFVFSLLFIFAGINTVSAASYMQGTAKWEPVSGAAYYHVYYKETGETNYTHGVLNLPASSTSVAIRHLKPGVRYWYNVVAYNSSKKEINWSGSKKLRVNWMK